VTKQLTFAPRNHQLTNTNVWTPDGLWLAFDVRPSGASFTSQTVERVNVATGEVEVIYQALAGAHVGVVTVNPQAPERYVFIHSPENPDAGWQYDFHHRRGVVVENGGAGNLDAMDITAPFTPGALRGGSHVHVWSPDGSRVSFTYNDHVMHEFNPAEDIRNVGVALPFGPVTPVKQHPREYDGSHYCVLVSRTTSAPRPGTDDINRAYEEGWVGEQGYRRADGSQQRWALAFIGDTRADNGEKVPELFIVDLPDSETEWRQAGAEPLEGTETTLPAPPASVKQRRLTFTHQRRFPGLVLQPRHWVRSSPDGSQLAFLMKDDGGVVQMWLISPQGGEPWQLTHGASDIQSAFNWHPSGKALGFVVDDCVVLCDAQSGETTPLTAADGECPSADAIVFSPDGTSIAWMQAMDGYRQLFTTRTELAARRVG
jgi:dipeptidyl aminopeptidase/acylaminoacyl peptidase